MGSEVKRVDQEWGWPVCEQGTTPPVGDGWQMWSTTSALPMSPVCKTPEGLASWLEWYNASWFGHDHATKERWLEFIKGPGWAPSLVFSPEYGLETGQDALIRKTKAE